MHLPKLMPSMILMRMPPPLSKGTSMRSYCCINSGAEATKPCTYTLGKLSSDKYLGGDFPAMCNSSFGSVFDTVFQTFSKNQSMPSRLGSQFSELIIKRELGF